MRTYTTQIVKGYLMRRSVLKMLTLLLLMIKFNNVQAQTFVTGPMNQQNTTGEYYNYTGIVLTNGFTSGSNFHAYIQSAPLVTCTPLSLNLSNNQNYIITYTPRSPFTNGVDLPSQ